MLTEQPDTVPKKSICDLDIEPFWLQSNLCNKEQMTWWSDCYNFIFNRKNSTKNISNQKNLTIEMIDSQFAFNLEIKKQTELAKVLEIIRLKRNLIKVYNFELQQEEKYQVNLDVCIHVANYFQSLIDNFIISKNEERLKLADCNDETRILFEKSSLLLEHLPK